jgi:hypothetical protein
MCLKPLPPGESPIAVNKYYYYYIGFEGGEEAPSFLSFFSYTSP